MAEIEKVVRAAFSEAGEPGDDGFAQTVSAKVPKREKRRLVAAILLAGVAGLSLLALVAAIGIGASLLPQVLAGVCRVWF